MKHPDISPVPPPATTRKKTFCVYDQEGATGIQILADSANPAAGYVALNMTKTYKVATTDFLALVSAYKDLFAEASNVVNTKRDISTLLTDKIQTNGTVTTALDGRMGTPLRK